MQSIRKTIPYSNFVSTFNNSNFNISKHDIPRFDLSQELTGNDDLLRRMKGCLLGLAIGDSIGGPYEFESKAVRDTNPVNRMTVGGCHNLVKGEWTDDTSMALCLSVSLICKGESNQYDQLMRYNWWRQNGYLSSRQNCFDIGNLTSFALSQFSQRKGKLFQSIPYLPRDSDKDILITDEIIKKNNVSLICGFDYGSRKAGNGSLMRLAPIPMFFCGLQEAAILAAEESSVTTHDDPEAVEACKFYSSLIIGALEGLGKDVILECGFYENFTKDKLKTAKIIDIANGSYKVNDDKDISGTGYVVNSLKAALWALYNDNESFETGVFLAINLGDDTDTTAAIYGQLAGALYGIDNIPGIWRRDVLYGDAIERIAEWLFACNRAMKQDLNLF